MSDAVRTVTDSSFEMQVLKADLPVLVFFYAEWSGAARRMAPLMEQIAAAYASRLAVARLATGAAPSATADQKVSIIPTLILYAKGMRLGVAPNVPDSRGLMHWLDTYLP